MRKIIFTYMMFISCFAFSKDVILNDTSVVMGKVENAWIGQETDLSCSLKSSIHIDAELVTVSGIRVCKTNTFFVEYYEIIYRNKPYLIERDNLKFDDSIDYYDYIQHFSKEIAEKFKEHATIVAAGLHRYILTEISKFMDKCRVQGVLIEKWGLKDESEYTEGTGAEFTFYNPTNKAIKYVVISLVGYNPVGDVVSKMGGRSVSFRAVGPIKPKESSEYTFDYLWHTDLVVHAKISSLTVQYMDGTTKIVKNPKAVIMPSEYLDYLNVE